MSSREAESSDGLVGQQIKHTCFFVLTGAGVDSRAEFELVLVPIARPGGQGTICELKPWAVFFCVAAAWARASVGLK